MSKNIRMDEVKKPAYTSKVLEILGISEEDINSLTLNELERRIDSWKNDPNATPLYADVITTKIKENDKTNGAYKNALGYLMAEVTVRQLLPDANTETVQKYLGILYKSVKNRKGIGRIIEKRRETYNDLINELQGKTPEEITVHLDSLVEEEENGTPEEDADNSQNAKIGGIADTSSNNVSQNVADQSGSVAVHPLKGYPHQIIFYGVPGNSKSYSVNKFLQNNNIEPFRVTFHPEMDYATFVGSYMPCSKGGNPTYEYQPQIFLTAYKKAKNNPDENVVLLIEEINRGNCAQIFGDILQLLDRNGQGESVYPITADVNLKKWLTNNGLGDTLALPSNLYIWATMNTSDQSLFPIDSAFLRRWKMQYVPIGKAGNYKIDGVGYSWKEIHEAINKMLEADCPEKMLGAHFIHSDISSEEFVGSVIYYLYKYIFPVYGNDNGIMARCPFDCLFKPKSFDEKTLQAKVDSKKLQELLDYIVKGKAEEDNPAGESTMVENNDDEQ